MASAWGGSWGSSWGDSWGQATAGVDNSLVSQDIVAGAPTVDAAALTFAALLEALSVDGASAIVGSPTVSLTVSLDGRDVVLSVGVVGSPEVSQWFELTAADITAGVPIVTAASVSQLFELTAVDVLGEAMRVGPAFLNAIVYSVEDVMLHASLSRIVSMGSGIVRQSSSTAGITATATGTGKIARIMTHEAHITRSVELTGRTR